MSESLSRFISMATPDVVETAARYYSSAPSADTHETSSPLPGLKISKPRRASIRATSSTTTLPALGKQEQFMTDPSSTQLQLDAPLVKFIDDQKTPEKRAEALIKIGQYQAELTKYAPVFREADDETIIEVLDDWFAAGHGELKKALVNVMSGSEDFPLIKLAPAEDAEAALALMIDQAPSDQARAALLQKMSAYGEQLHNMLGRGEMMKMDPAIVDAAIADWVESGDGSHSELKKALANASAMARRRARASVGENEAIGEKAGNAATHAGSRLSGQHDHTYASRHSGEGVGPRMRGSHAAPAQAHEDSPRPGSGPNDTGEGGVSPTIHIRRRGTTGGLGSVSGEMRSATPHVGRGGSFANDHEMNRKKRRMPRRMMDKNSDLAVELVKIAPDTMIEALEDLSDEDRLAVCSLAADDAADLLAWSGQHGDQLQKSSLDAAVKDWLTADPETIAVKQWVAEALASAEEIPLALGKAIMEFTPPAPVSTSPRLRQPSTAAA